MSFLGEAVVGVGADTSAFEGETKRAVETASANAAKTMQNAGRKMTSVGTSLTAKVTAPILGVAAASLKVAGDFEQTMNVLQSATGAPKKAMADMRKQAIDLGRDTVFSANESAEAMLELGKAGLTSKETMAAVPEVLNLAATEGLGLAQSAGIVTSAMAPFQLKADEVGQAVNALAGASNASKASVATLSEALKLVGGAAAGTGLTVQETTGALAALANNGLEGGIAGTSLAGVLRRLQPQTEAAAGAMSDLGLNFVKANGEFDSIDVVAGKLQKTFKGMAPAARQAALSKIFGNDASVMQAVNGLINAGAEGLQKYTKASSNQSAAQKLADARMKGFKGTVEAMKGSLETAGLTIGTILIPYVTKAADFIGNMADKFGTLSPQVQKIILVFAGIAAAIGPVLIVVGTLISSIGTIAGVFAGLTAAIAAPIAAIVLIGAALAVFFAKSEAARAMVVATFNEIKGAIMGAVGPITEMIQGQLLPAFEAMWPILEKVGLIILKVFAGAVVGAIKGVINVVKGVVQVITGVVQVVSGILTGDWSRVWDGVKNIVKGALTAIKGVIQVWLNVGFLSIFRKGFTLLTGVIRGGWNLLKGLFKSSTGALTSVVRGAWNVIKGATSAVWNAIKAVLSAAWGVIKGIVTGNLGAIRGAVSAGFNALKGIASNAWNAVSTAVRNGVTKAVNFVKELPGKAVSALGDLSGKLVSAGTSLISGFIKGITSKIGEVKDTLGNLTSKLTSWKGPPSTDAVILFENGQLVIQGFVDGLESNIPLVRQTLSDFTTLVGNAFSPAEVGKALSGITTAFEQINEDIATANQNRADAALAASKKEFDAERASIEKSAKQREAALRKKYDGKGEEKKLRKKLDALEKETDKSLSKLEAREKKAARAIEKTRKDNTSSLQGVASAHRAVIESIANAWDSVDLSLNGDGGIRDQLSEARSILESEIDKMASYAEGVGSRLIESVFKSDGKTPPTLEDIIGDLTNQEAQAEAFATVLQQLADMGLNTTSYDQIAQAGPEALAAAQALVEGGDAAIAQVNALQSSINQYAQDAGDTAATYLYAAGISAAQAVVDGLEAQESTLVDQMTMLGNALGTAMAAAISAVQMPGGDGGGSGGGGKGGDDKHKWVPVSDKNRKCKICGRARNASVHTNRGEGHASGSMSTPGGWALVGERGPELLNLPGGSRVYPAHQTERMVGSASASAKPEQHFHVHMPTGDPEAAAMAVANRAVRGL